MSISDEKLPETGDAEFDRVVALGASEAKFYAEWLAGTSQEELSPFARRGLAHSFGRLITELTCAPPSNSRRRAVQAKPEKLTKAEAELLRVIHPGRPINITDAAAILGKPLEVVSRSRNRLAAKGYVAGWANYLDALRLTDAGRRAALNPGASNE